MQWVPQRTDEDCGCAALAMLLDLTYEDVAEAWRAALSREPNKSTYADLIKVAAHLGHRLVRKRTTNGIRRIRPEPNCKHSHWVVLRGDTIYCPAAGIHSEAVYLWKAWGHGLELRKRHDEEDCGGGRADP